jgi:hypothetical protein
MRQFSPEKKANIMEVQDEGQRDQNPLQEISMNTIHHMQSSRHNTQKKAFNRVCKINHQDENSDPNLLCMEEADMKHSPSKSLTSSQIKPAVVRRRSLLNDLPTELQTVIAEFLTPKELVFTTQGLN